MHDKRILFLGTKQYNLLSPISYRSGMNLNTGNFVFFIAGASFFYSQDIITTYISRDELVRKLTDNHTWVKDNFDICIHMEANILNPVWKQQMLEKAVLFKRMGIPVYILGIGTQSTIDYDTSFVKGIDQCAKEYLDSIYGGGGACTARGYFSRYVMEELGFPEVFVSGCPSLYYNNNSEISNIKVSREDFKLALNGNYVSDLNKRIYEENPLSIFFDQGVYLSELYEPQMVNKFEKHLYPFSKLYEESRIDGDINYYMWSKYLCLFSNFSYGTKIHGNIVALQNNIPAFVNIIDSRTREICEFYRIPNSISNSFNETQDSLYDLYNSLDYTNFNQRRQDALNKFKEWLDEKRIPNVVGKNREYKRLIQSWNYYNYREDENIRKYKRAIIDRFPKK